MRRTLSVAFATVGLTLVCMPANAALVNVYVFNFDFSTNAPPGSINDPIINLGDTVRWNWIDDLHSTTSVAGIPEVWDSGVLNAGQTYDHTFTNPGTFWYFCTMHGFDNGNGTAQGMAGTVTVVPGECPRLPRLTTAPACRLR